MERALHFRRILVRRGVDTLERHRLGGVDVLLVDGLVETKSVQSIHEIFRETTEGERESFFFEVRQDTLQLNCTMLVDLIDPVTGKKDVPQIRHVLHVLVNDLSQVLGARLIERAVEAKRSDVRAQRQVETFGIPQRSF